MKARILQLLVCFGVLLATGVVHAAPLTNTQLGVFQTFLSCRTRCSHAKVALLSQCNARCDTETGATPAERASWDKNLNGVTDGVDYELAVLESLNVGGNLICYENSAVVPKNACGLATCTATRTAAQCADADGDGVRAYQEALIGTSDTVVTKSCLQHAECGGYTSDCRWMADANKRLCMNRCPAGAPCTAFHLEEVVQDNGEVIVRVVYDYTPTPATVLDLKIAYNQSALNLIDSRPLGGLTRNRKTLSAKQNPSGYVRLVVLSDDNSVPIPFGPIAELVFARTSPLASTISFVLSDYEQTMSMAPDPGQYKAGLAADSLWGCSSTIPGRCQGSSLSIGGATPSGDRMMLYYSFDDPARPLDYSDAKGTVSASSMVSGDALCALIPECKILRDEIPVEKQKKTLLKARYAQLQRGVVDTGSFAEGVNGSAAFFDGFGNHIELPVTVNDPASGAYSSSAQSFSLSSWFYNDGDAKTGTTGQVLFSHNTQASELTRFGLMVVPRASGGLFDLVFFQGDITSGSVSKQVVALPTAQSDLADRRWTHVGMSVDAGALRVRFYINGAPSSTVATLASSPALACPQLETAPATGMITHNFGEGIVGAKTPDSLFLATAQNNLLGLEQMDLNGLSRRTLLRTGKTSAQDPDYSPITDKLVYSSSEGGNYEIWLANGDGSNPQQITSGFGDTARGIFARRPKWAPDGSGIVFESNAFDNNYLDNSTNPPTIGDNLRIRAYHLFYIAFDTTSSVVAIPLAGGSTTTKLDYAYLIANQVLKDYRLTTTETGSHHYDAFWLQGKYTESGTSYLGELVFSRADGGYRNANIGRVQIRNPVNSSLLTTLSPALSNAAGSDVRLLTARRTVGQTPNVNRLLISQEWKSYDSDATTPYQLVATPVETNGEITLSVQFKPPVYSPTCWDANQDSVCQPGENRNGDRNTNGTDKCDVNDCYTCWDQNLDKTCQPDENRNGDKNADNTHKCDFTDCYPSSIRDLYIAYNPNIVAPTKVAGTGEIVATTGAWLESNGKKVDLGDNATLTSAYVKVDVVSNLNDKPIPAGTALTTIKFTRRTAGTTGLAVAQRKINQKLWMWSDSASPTPFSVGATDFEEVLDARFSPGVDRLVLSGLARSRPIVARTVNLSGTALMEKLSTSAVKVEGLDWEPTVRVYPCNWVGTFRNPGKGVYSQTFRGALDELKLYSYVRPPDAFASEAARGTERLIKDGRAGELQPVVGACTTSFDCPSYQICNGGACTTTSCVPTIAYPCAQGTCTLLPVPLDDGRATPKWVCAVECTADTQCFAQECMNGPCRFCAAGSACTECKSGPKDLGGIVVNYVEGCPDRNAFMCDQGSCISQCYTFENGTSQFLCDPAVEYCKQGRCVLNKWDWPDFGPATFAGLGQQVFDTMTLTTALTQLYPIEIQAYGMEDYIHDPEVLVQGKASGVYGGDWFDLGRIIVRNKTTVQAEAAKYVLHAPHQVSELRFQLVNPPYANLNAAASGLTARDEQMCARRYGLTHRDLCKGVASCEAAWAAFDKTLCYRRTPSSRAQLGYASNVSRLESMRAGNQSLGVEGLHRFLIPGAQSVILHAVKVGTASVSFSKNTICSYEGSWDPLRDASGAAKAQIFGGLNGAIREASNQAAGLRATNSTDSWGLVDLRSPSNGSVGTDMAILNCPFAAYGSTSPQVAEALGTVPSNAYSAAIGSITENANGCFAPKGNTQEPCYEWIGGEASLDPYNGETVLYGTLDYDTYHSFGYDACKPTAQAGVVDCSDTSALRN